MQKKILVTGGAGFIASCLAQRLADNPDNFVVVVDNLLTGSKTKLPVSVHDNVRFIKADVNNFNDISTIFSSFSFDFVFHYAALVGVKRTLANPVMVLNDLNGIRNVLDLCKNTGVKRIYFSSSSEVYGEPVEFPQNEHTTPLNSRLPYAIVKNVGEAYLRAYYQEYSLEFTIFRFFNTYGPRQSTDFVMSKFMAAALSNQDITIYGDGSQTRTFCYIDDNIDATLNAFYQDLVVNDVANIGSDYEITILDLAEKIVRITGSSSKIIFLPALKEGDMTRRCPDISVMKQLLQRKLTPMEEGIQRLISSKHSITA
ncbi:MAG: NAD-dependent epimerase/dehydratase family protein [Bacteroidia bacterium]|nr:NAD-dependent epimerase/dehydratase family protein [Bacteroidia bacterium]